MVRRNHFVEPTPLSEGAHNCALVSVYRTVSHLSVSQIMEAFGFCTKKWPYGGVSNKELAITLKFLGVRSTYSDRKETLGELLKRKPSRCIALLHGHFVAIVDGKLVGNDQSLSSCPKATIYCHWTIH